MFYTNASMRVTSDVLQNLPAKMPKINDLVRNLSTQYAHHTQMQLMCTLLKGLPTSVLDGPRHFGWPTSVCPPHFGCYMLSIPGVSHYETHASNTMGN
jgi:hypothetical protein